LTVAGLAMVDPDQKKEKRPRPPLVAASNGEWH